MRRSSATVVLVSSLVAFAARAAEPGNVAPAPAAPASAASAGDTSSSAELDGWIARLTGADADARAAAAAATDGASVAMTPGIAAKLAELRRTVRAETLAAALAATRKRAADDGPRRKRDGAKDKAAKDAARDGKDAKDAGDGPDAFDRALAAPRPDDPAWRALVTVLGLERLLARIATPAAVRELIGVHGAWGEPVRVDVQRLVQRLGDRAVPALIDLRRSPDARVRGFVAKQLDVLGKAVPGEAVQTSDNQVLAEVLRAYGRARDVEAARVIVSFANSDRGLVRDAAREAVKGLGEAALWQLRDSYESVIGKKPPDDWGWERTAQELFAAYDRSRLGEVYSALDEGLAKERAGDLEAMATAFDRALARAPTFDRRAETVPGYEKLARSIEATDPVRAAALFRKALRVDPTGPRAGAIGAELAWLDAEDLARRGLVDPAAYRRVLALAPAHAGAQAALDRIDRAASDDDAALRRWLAAGGVALAALLGVAWLLWPRGRRDARA